jgi:hypothetical protein
MSKASAQRVLLMQTNIAGLHGTRFGIRTMEARLRSSKLLPRRRRDQADVAFAGADWLSWIEEEGTDGPGEAVNPDHDPDHRDDSDVDGPREARYPLPKTRMTRRL